MKKERVNKNCTNCDYEWDECCGLSEEEVQGLPEPWFIKKIQLRCKLYKEVKKK